MNKRDADEIVAQLTAWSLRRLADHPSRWEQLPMIPKNLTKSQQGKVSEAMRRQADKLESKYTAKEPIDASDT